MFSTNNTSKWYSTMWSALDVCKMTAVCIDLNVLNHFSKGTPGMIFCNVIGVRTNKPLRLGGAYIRQKTGSILVYVMVCRLCRAKPLFEPTVLYCWYAPQGKLQIFLLKKSRNVFQQNAWKKRLRNVVQCVHIKWSNPLTHCGLMTPYGDIDIGQH